MFYYCFLVSFAPLTAGHFYLNIINDVKSQSRFGTNELFDNKEANLQKAIQKVKEAAAKGSTDRLFAGTIHFSLFLRCGRL
jgi:hypothetical protein